LVEDIAPRLDGWDAINEVTFDSAVARMLPYSHVNATSVDTLLDHVAISRTLDEVYDHPIRVQRADGTPDLQPGIQIARPLIPEEQYQNLTDPLPVVLILRTTTARHHRPQRRGAFVSCRPCRTLPAPTASSRRSI
jgi:hypothetical protein